MFTQVSNMSESLPKRSAANAVTVVAAEVAADVADECRAAEAVEAEAAESDVDLLLLWVGACS